MIQSRLIYSLLALIALLSFALFFFAPPQFQQTEHQRPPIADLSQPIFFQMYGFRTDAAKNRIRDPRKITLEVKDQIVTQIISEPNGEVLSKTERPLSSWYWLQRYAMEGESSLKGEQARDGVLYQWFEVRNANGKLYQVLVSPENGLVREVVDERGLGFELVPQYSSPETMHFGDTGDLH